MNSLILASSNKGKIKEITTLLAPLGLQVVPQTKWNVPDAEETGLSFVENALLKARNCARHTKQPALAEDSGLCVDALHGAPGIYSARYAGLHGDDGAKMDKLLKAMQNIPPAQRGAHYKCVLVWVQHERDPSPYIAEGRLGGHITTQRRGTLGFGYDPVFYLEAHGKTLAEVPPSVKNKISHRRLALEKMQAQLHQSCSHKDC